MAFGTSSKMFVAFIEACLENQAAYNLSSDAVKLALFNNTITAPDATAALASISFGSGVWAANEVFDGAEWATGGQALDSVTSTLVSNVWKLTAANEVSVGTSATLADVRGCLVYDDTVADVGICFLSFGGSNAVTDGTFTVNVNAAGLATITV